MADFEPCDASCFEQKRRATPAFMGIHLGIGSFDNSGAACVLRPADYAAADVLEDLGVLGADIRTTQIYARITNKKIEHDMEQLSEKLGKFNSAMGI